MAVTSDMFDQLRDYLDDATDAQVTFANKKLYLNRGIARLWPRIFRIYDAGTIAVVANQYEYDLPAGMKHGRVVSVEMETGNLTGTFVTLQQYEVIPAGDAVATKLKVSGTLPAVGAKIRVRYAAPAAQIAAASYAAAQSETWLWPDEAIGLPVIYALGLISVRRLDNRQDFTRYSTTIAENGTTETDLIGAASLYFGQFEAELDELSKRFMLYLPRLPLPEGR